MAWTPEAAAGFPPAEENGGQGLVLTALALLALGVVMVHSAAVATGAAWYAQREVRHTLFAALAAGVLFAGRRLDYRRLVRPGRLPLLPAIALGVALATAVLAFVPGLGRSVNGCCRWVRLWPGEHGLSFQPSELIKLALVVFLAAWLSDRSRDPRSWRTVLPALGAVAVSAALIITEDFGTAALLGIVAGVTLILAGVPVYYLLALAATGAAGAYAFVVRVPHRWARITAMMDPWATAHAGTYQPRQSLIGIITGGWTGKGPGAGMQKLFLPERATDFIFSVFCEEWGFIGAALLMGLVLLWIWHVRRAALRAPDPFGRLLAGSIGFMIAFQAVLHIAVDLVAAPPTGMSFPFVSAGGTSLVVMAAGAALVASVGRRARRGATG